MAACSGPDQHPLAPGSNAAYWAGKVARNRERDRLADETLTAAGWTVVRIWEHEAPEAAARRIEATVRGCTAPDTTRPGMSPPDPRLVGYSISRRAIA